MSEQPKLRRRLPILHILLGLLAWTIYLSGQRWQFLVVAICLSVLAILRLVRGSLPEADQRITRQLAEPITASDRVASQLTPGETLRVEVTDHPLSMLWRHIFAAAISVGSFMSVVYLSYIGVWVVWTALIVWSISMLYYSVKVLLWRKDKLCVTDKRIFVVRGIFKTRYEFMPLEKLATAKIRTPWHSNILAWLRIIEVPYGTLIADAAGEEDELKKNNFIPWINQISRMLSV